MASRHQNVSQSVCCAVEDELVNRNQSGKRMHSDDNETMKQVRTLECKKVTSKIKRLSTGQKKKQLPKTQKVRYSVKKTRNSIQSNLGNTEQHPKFWGCDMANKENEVVSSGTLPNLFNDNHSNQLSSVDSPTSQTDGASTTCRDYFPQISKDHAAMMRVLFGRNLRLNVALTFWQKSASELVAYLVRIQDVAVIADCLPVITKSLEEEKQSISIGCCVDLLPLAQELLRSRFEEYLIVGLNWLLAVIKRWWPELSANTKNSNEAHEKDQNIQIMKDWLQQLREQRYHLSSVPGYTGKVAKSVGTYLEQLH
ncbi:KATNB1-like protein 1 isoform X1 [Callorhinchus milii]|nr:KATNB1-like protein 1 isoform X1 [Callorhinchus milii]|eukprot:gi/632942155/ref/XP_007886259.1/ PREDICTED: KATNB1-like protein 1 [Callorhinchus milii]